MKWKKTDSLSKETMRTTRVVALRKEEIPRGMSSDGFTWYILNLSIVYDGYYELILMYQQEYVDFNLGFMMSRSAVSET